MPEDLSKARTKFLQPKIITKGQITEVSIEQEPFHCIVKIIPNDPDTIPVEGRYSSNQLSLGKLKRNLVHLGFKIDELEDIIPALESLEGRQCSFKIDQSGWIEWISKLHTPNMEAEDKLKEAKSKEVFFIRHIRFKSIYQVEDRDGKILYYAVGPTKVNTPKVRGWVLNIETIEEAQEILRQRKL